MVTAQLAQPSGCSESATAHGCENLLYKSADSAIGVPFLALSVIHPHVQQRLLRSRSTTAAAAAVLSPSRCEFLYRCYCSCVVDESVCHQGHRLVKVTTLSSLSSRTRVAMVVSLAINRSLSLKRFMCTPKVPTRGVGIPIHAELFHVVSSLRPRRTVAFARRAWQVSACVVVRKVRGFAVTSLPYYVLTRLVPTSLQKYAHVFSERVLLLAE
jgi:hypothetical protein